MIITGIVSGCSYDDSAIKERLDKFDDRISALELQVSRMNTNIGTWLTTLTALEDGDRIVSVTPLEDGTGYSIHFSKTGTVIIYHGKTGNNGKDGENGHSPKIGVKQDADGVFYWTVDGEWLIDDNDNKIPATSKIVTPLIRVSDDNKHYEISFDDGITWLIVGDVAESDFGKTIFEDVKDNGNNVTFYLVDGGKIVIPKVQKFSLEIEESTFSIQAGEMKFVSYIVSGSDEKTVVDGFGTNGFIVVVRPIDNTSGNVEITAPAPLVNGKVFLFAINGEGTTSAKILNFEEGIISIDDSAVSELVPAGGGVISIPVETNLSYNVIVSPDAESWISYSIEPSTKSIRKEIITLTISPNISKENRTGDVVILNSETNEMLKYLSIVQKGDETEPGNTDGFGIGDWQNDGNITL